jgi:3-keto-5-aminohexanoate cleavage enzyme
MSLLLNSLESPVPIVLAPTGMVFTRAQSDFIPLQPAEIAADVALAADRGITAVHLHARDLEGAPTWNRDIYADIITRIRSRNPELIINVSTSGRTWSELERRADVLSLDGDTKPDIASLTLSSMNFINGASLNSPDTIRNLARIMRDRGITPELEIFDLGMINFARVLHREGLLPATVPANLFFGNIAGLQATLSEMGVATALVPDFVQWNGAGLGASQNRAQALAVNSGGGVRVGLEDGLYFDAARTTLATNLSLLERVHSLCELAGRSVMSPSEYRSQVLGS